MEDLFYFIRENNDAKIHFENLFDLVLSGIDFIKGEVEKIQNDGEADGSNELLVSKSSSLIENMKEASGKVVNNDLEQTKQDTNDYISSDENSSAKVKQKYLAKIFYEDGCGMEDVRSYGVINSLEDSISEIYHIPEDITENKEIFSNILLPGFSTNENVTEYSGRGVGMDVVKKNIDSIGGSISITSEQGKGTIIFIKIPLTLAIIHGLEVAVGKCKYTIPITNIRESFKPKENEVITDGDGNEMIMIRGEAYPIYRIHRMFNINTDVTSSTHGIMVMVEDNMRAACLWMH